MSGNLPAQYANDGYDVVTARGNVIEHVPAKKTAQELEIDAKLKVEEQKRQAEQASIQAAIDKEKRQDYILLQTFMATQDIERLRDEKIASIKIVEGITLENLKRLRDQLDTARDAAANFERMGKPTPTNVTKTISESKRQIKDSEDFIQRKHMEKLKITKEFTRTLERFNKLKETQQH